MADCIVIGAGICGLTTAANLAESGHKVTVLEASPKLGGRAYSFKWNGLEIDNGQHLMLNCYTETLKYLKLTGGIEKTELKNILEIPFVSRGGRTAFLRIPEKFYPFNLLYSLLRFNGFNLRERIKILALFVKLPLINPEKLKEINIYNWLENNNQSDKIISNFWEILAVSMLNTPIKKASAEIFIKILKTVFMKRNNYLFLLPSQPLDEVFSLGCKKYLIEKGCKIESSEKVIAVNFEKDKAVRIVTNKKEYSEFNYVFCTVPIHALKKILPESIVEVFNISELETAPIINIHFKLKENGFNKDYYALMGSKIHWVFNKKTHLNLVISAGNEFLKMNDEEIFDFATSELQNYFPCFYKSLITDFIVIKEKRAAFMSTTESSAIRKKVKENIGNLFIAGDWTNTDLPSTIESAAKSGRISAGKI